MSGDEAANITNLSSVAKLGSTGAAGTVIVAARELELRSSGQISSSTFGSGNAGSVTVQADRLSVSGDDAADLTGIFSSVEPESFGHGGTVAIAANELELRDGGQISSSSFSRGSAGSVKVEANRIQISGDGAPSLTGIASTTGPGSIGAGGTANIQAQAIHLEKGGVITTESAGLGPGGSISISAKDILELDDAAISAQTAIASGGDLTFSVGRLVHLSDSTLTTSVAGGTGDGGNITGSTRFLVLDDSRIVADAHRGTSGNITILADLIVRSPKSVIKASTELKIIGDPEIDPPNAALVVTPFLDPSSLQAVSCARRGGAPASSLVPGGRGGLPPDPDAPLSATLSSSFADGRRANQVSSNVEMVALPPLTETVSIAGMPHQILGVPRTPCRG
jgi:large exoprotein involved in heme utilization and adhesion